MKIRSFWAGASYNLSGAGKAPFPDSFEIKAKNYSEAEKKLLKYIKSKRSPFNVWVLEKEVIFDSDGVPISKVSEYRTYRYIEKSEKLEEIVKRRKVIDMNKFKKSVKPHVKEYRPFLQKR